MTSPLESRPDPSESHQVELNLVSVEIRQAFIEEIDTAIRTDALISQAIVDGFHDNTLRANFSQTPSVVVHLEDTWVLHKEKSTEFLLRRYRPNDGKTFSVAQLRVDNRGYKAEVDYWSIGEYGESSPPKNTQESITESQEMWAEYKRQQEAKEAATQQ